ncbi:MAG TPA: hypothetical protein VI653_24175, partial [Steroidobacteraceae bacterium]
MEFGLDGEGIRHVPPASPAPTSQQLQDKVDGAQATVAQDKSRIGVLKGDLKRAEDQDEVRVQQVIELESEIKALQAQLEADQAAANKDQVALNKSLATQLPNQTTQAIDNYGAAVAHAPGSLDETTARTQLHSALFNQEVMYYEQQHGGKLAVPGSQAWQKDAQALLTDHAALRTTRVAIAWTNRSQAAAHGLDLKHLGAQEWAGEQIAAAQLHDPQTADGSKGICPTLEDKAQGEQSAVLSLSQSLTSLNDPATSGVDPQLARQALFGDAYVATLGNEIPHTMHDISVTKGQTSADGIGFLYRVVHQPGVDLGLATVLIRSAAPQLRQFLSDQSKASGDQAATAFTWVAGLYGVLLDANHAGAPGAGTLAQELAQWSYSAANAISSSTNHGFTDNKLAAMMRSLWPQILKQGVAPNLLYAWEDLSAGEAAKKGNMWGFFKVALDGNAQLAPWTPVGAQPPTTTPLTSDQVHAYFNGALEEVTGQQGSGGSLPRDINPVMFAAVETEMVGGYTSKDDGVLARAMIAGQQQQLELAWQKQHRRQPVLMPVNALTAQAGADVLALGNQIGLGGPSWSNAVGQGVHGIQAAASRAPSRRIIEGTTTAYTRLRKAQASGNASAIARAQQQFDEAVMRELRAVYGGRFSGDSLFSDNENASWNYQAEVQVLRDHAGSTAMIEQVAVRMQKGEIVDLALQPGQDVHTSVLTLDTQLAPLQQPGAAPGSDPVTKAVLSDPRVQRLISGQVGVATTGSAGDPTGTLANEASVLAWYDEHDSTGPVAHQITTGSVESGVTRQILANAVGTAAINHDPLGTAAPLMQAAQASPTLTLAVYNDFNLPVTGAPGAPSADAPAPNALTAAAGSVHSAADYRNLAIIYGTLPDGLPQGEAGKAALIRAFGAELSQPNSTAAGDIANWIPASFDGKNSAPAALANDLTTGYQYVAGDQIATVGKLGNSQLASTIRGALFQKSDKGDGSAPFFGSAVNMDAAASADGSTLQGFDSEASFTAYVAQAYGLQPISGGGANAVYDLNTVVYGQTTLGQIVIDLKRQAGVTSLGVDNPIVLQAAPVSVGEQLAAQFRVQQQDGSIVWLGPDGAVTAGWHGQDAALTGHVSTTVVQVAGGVVEADPFGNITSLLKTDTAPPPQSSHPWWESVAEDTLAVTVGLVVSAVADPLVG